MKKETVEWLLDPDTKKNMMRRANSFKGMFGMTAEDFFQEMWITALTADENRKKSIRILALETASRIRRQQGWETGRKVGISDMVVDPSQDDAAELTWAMRDAERRSSNGIDWERLARGLYGDVSNTDKCYRHRKLKDLGYPGSIVEVVERSMESPKPRVDAMRYGVMAHVAANRRDRGLRLVDVDREMGWHPGTTYQLEVGLLQSRPKTEKLLDFFGMTWHDFITHESYHVPKNIITHEKEG
jgi:hypothetical protein